VLQGYTANRNRTLHHLYSNEIPNTAFLAGDSHANWVSDLVWLDETPYDQVTGAGAIGVEFAGTAVSSSGYGAGRSIANSSDRSAGLVRDNRELQWAEGYYRGYYELHISPDELNAHYYGNLSSLHCPLWCTLTKLRLSIRCVSQPFRAQSC
jgi:alkaline phosphatase D